MERGLENIVIPEKRGERRENKRIASITGKAQAYLKEEIIYGDRSIHLPEHGSFLDNAIDLHFMLSNYLLKPNQPTWAIDVKEILSDARKAFTEDYHQMLETYVQRISNDDGETSAHVMNFSYESDLFLEHCDAIESALVDSKNLDDFKRKSAYISLSNMLNMHDENTYHHSRRVAENTEQFMVYLVEIGEASFEEIQEMTDGAYFHDMGKIGVSSKILNKKGKYDDHEKNLIKDHTDYGAALVSHLGPVIENVARHHHEMPNGKGYKLGLSGAVIPKQGLIVAITDSLDAMTDSNRKYKDPMTLGQALRELQEFAGIQFDKRYADLFLRGVSEGKINISQNDSNYVVGQYMKKMMGNVVPIKNAG